MKYVSCRFFLLVKLLLLANIRQPGIAIVLHVQVSLVIKKYIYIFFGVLVFYSIVSAGMRWSHLYLYLFKMENKLSAEQKNTVLISNTGVREGFNICFIITTRPNTHIWFKENIRCFLSFFFFWSTAEHLIAAISTKCIHKRYFGLIASNFVRVQEFYILRFMKQAKLWPRFHTRENVMNGTTAFDDA